MDQTQEKEESKENTVDVKDILATAISRFSEAEEATRDTRNLGDEDIKFIAGEQWPENIKNTRESEGRPVITINRCPQTVRNVTNDQRLNRPAIKVYPVDDKADPLTAKILQGLIRQIENESNAEIAYDTAFDNAVKRSYGYWRIITDYESPTSFKQKVLIKRIRNPNSVLLDPFHKERDGSDANWGFIFDDISHDEYKKEYGETDLGKSANFILEGRDIPGWITENSCRIAEYFTKEFKDDELFLLDNGESVLKSEFEEFIQKAALSGVMPQIKTKRKTKIPIIKWYKTNGLEILDEGTFPGQYIPIVKVIGDEHDINGKVIIESVVRHSKDSQRMYNYLKSTEAETITLAPKTPFIAAEGQIPKEYAPMWRNVNHKNYPYLIYKPTTHEGQLVPPPQRQTFEPPIQSMVQASMLASEDIKNTSGVTDAAMGNKSNEQSGLAINSRAQQAQRNNFHFTDNLNLSIKHTGRILVDIIPIVYDAPQAVRILGEDNQGEIVKINELFTYKGEEKHFDFSIGKYDVTCETGPGFATKRQEALQSMLEISKNVPQVMQSAPDLIIKNMDWPGASDIAERLKKTLPPGIADDPEQKPIPPQVQAQMQQMDQMIQALTEKLNEANEREKTKSMELESKERIEFAKMQNNLVIEQLKLQGQAANQLLAAELADIKQRLSLLDINEPFDTENNESNFNESVPDQDATQNENYEQQPIGGASPSQPYGEMP